MLQFTRNRNHSTALIPRLWGRGGSQRLKDAQFKGLVSISLPEFRNTNFPPKRMMLPPCSKIPNAFSSSLEKKCKLSILAQRTYRILMLMTALTSTPCLYHSRHRACLLDVPPICHSVPPHGPYTCHHSTCLL